MNCFNLRPHCPVASRSFRLATRANGLRPSAIREILKLTEAPDVISFAGGLPAPELFPVETVARAAAKVVADDGPAALQYSTTEGFGPLREWICAYLAQTNGPSASPDQVLVVQGSQQGLDLAAKMLLDPNDVVLVENPAYLGALQAFRVYQAHVVGVRSDAAGMLPNELRDALERATRRPKFLYVVPNFQNPTGTSLAAERRADLVRLAAEYGVPIVEDNPYGDLRYRGEALPALGALPGAHDWIYVGTASKVFAPGLRVAWLVTPNAEIRAKLVAAKQASDLHTSTFSQRLLWECVRVPGALADHVARLRSVYTERRDAMLNALRNHLPDGATWTHPDGGLFVWVTLPETFDATELLKRALSEKVAFVPGESFWVGTPRKNTLRLSFSNSAPPRIAEGIARLGQAIKG